MYRLLTSSSSFLMPPQFFRSLILVFLTCFLFQFFETVVRYDRFFSSQTQHIPTVLVRVFSVDCIKTKKAFICINRLTVPVCRCSDLMDVLDSRSTQPGWLLLGTLSCFIHYSYSASLHIQGNQRICILGVTLQETSFPVGRRNTPSHFMQRGYSQPDGPIGLNADFTNLWHCQYFSGFF